MNKISNAASTQGGYKAAMKRFDAFQRERNDPEFCDLKELHIHEDHLQKLMLDYGTYLAKTDLYYAKKILSADAKGKYFGKLKEALKEKFPKHKAFTDMSWYTTLKSDIEKGATRTNFLSNDFFDNKTLSFYPSLKSGYIRENHRSLIFDGVQEQSYAHDMNTLCYLLMESASKKGYMDGGPLQQRAWFVMCMLAVARGGEIKYQRYDEWLWDDLYHSIDATWSEMKTLTKHCMMFGPDKDSHVCDFFHAFGSFFSVENGLHRAVSQDPAIKQCVFPYLHKFKNSNVAAKLTAIMRKYASPALADRISSRSIRKGATNFLSMHKSITEAELNARGCWVSESNSRAYRETTPILSIPGQNALANWNDVRTPKYAPRLECLGAHTQEKIEQFIYHLFLVDVPAFGPGGRLRPFLRACTAAMIMYHFQVVKDYGHRHRLVEKVVLAAEQAEVCDGALSDPVEVLRHWANLIKADFDKLNPDILDPMAHSLQECISHSNVLLQKALAETAACRITINDQQRTIEHLAQSVAAVSRVSEETAHSVAVNSRATEGIAHSVDAIARAMEIKSPPPRRSPIASAPIVSHETSGNALVRLSTADNESEINTPPNSSQLTADGERRSSDGKRRSDQLILGAVGEAVPKRRRSKTPPSLKNPPAILKHLSAADTAGPKNPPVILKHSSVAEAAGQSSAKTEIANVLLDLYHAKKFHGNKDRLRSMSLSHISERSKFTATLELVECVISDDQWSELCKSGQPVRDTMATANAVQQVCMTTLLAWEVSAGLKKPQKNTNLSRSMPYYIGVGARVVAYKKALEINGALFTAPKPTSKPAAAAKKPKSLLQSFLWKKPESI